LKRLQANQPLKPPFTMSTCPIVLWGFYIEGDIADLVVNLHS